MEFRHFKWKLFYGKTDPDICPQDNLHKSDTLMLPVVQN